MMEHTSVLAERATSRSAARKRREAKAALRQVIFEALAAGWSVEQIAELRKVSPRTIRREVDRALAERRLDAPDRYVHLQVARLMKALRLADAALDSGDLKAIGPLVKVVNALDRYHGLAALSSQPPAPTAVPCPPPAPPLQLTRAAPPLAEAPSGIEEWVANSDARRFEMTGTAPEMQRVPVDRCERGGPGDAAAAEAVAAPTPGAGESEIVTDLGAQDPEITAPAPELQRVGPVRCERGEAGFAAADEPAVALSPRPRLAQTKANPGRFGRPRP
ncbi:helix-turn-helix domain-containing protein [Roseiarcus sp.]|uniref:helix-turn-helix domain-containing protein n=1 Tax=Roseiarcus sp. TaxID=1969460 RepID=UPI003F985D33